MADKLFEHPQSKLSADQWAEVLALVYGGRSVAALAKEYGITPTAIYKKRKAFLKKVSDYSKGYQHKDLKPSSDLSRSENLLRSIASEYQTRTSSNISPVDGQGLPARADLDPLAPVTAAADRANALIVRAHRARSKALWRRLKELTADDDLGQGKAGKAAAMGALAAAHEKLVRTDRLIMGIDKEREGLGDRQGVKVVVAVATATPAQWEDMVSKHSQGDIVKVDVNGKVSVS